MSQAKRKVQPRFNWKTALPKIKELSALGFRVVDVCQALGISKAHWYRLRERHKEFGEGFDQGRTEHLRILCHELIENHVKIGHDLKATQFAMRAQHLFRDHGPVKESDVEAVNTPPLKVIMNRGGEKK